MMSGYLKKKAFNTIGQSQTLWYFIQETQASIYLACKEKENEYISKGEIDIDLILDLGYTGKNKFNIVYPEKYFELEADSKDEAERWVLALIIIK